MAASKPVRLKAEGTKALVWFHRWLGIATCAIFAMWFASGAVLLFQPFPSLSRAEQMKGAAAVRLGTVRVSPAQAAATAGGTVAGMRLVARAGEPAYIVDTDTNVVAIDARDGSLLAPIDGATAQRIATHFLQRPPAAVRGPLEYDQWIVDNGFDSTRPFYRIDAGDAAGTQIYVSARTGEVVQQTQMSERAWSWVGAVLHWVYFSPLRASFSAWDKVVWSMSLLASVVAVAGIALGVIRTLAVRRAGRKGLTFFRLKWLKYHHLLGLFISVFVIGWVASGWLSMDHGRLFSQGQPSPSELKAYQGRPISDALVQIDVPALLSLPPTKEVRIAVIDGQILLISSDASGNFAAFDARAKPLSAAALDGRMRGAIARAWPEAGPIDGNEVAATDFYAVAEGMPKTVRRYAFAGEKEISVYADGATGSIVTVMDGSRAAYDWFYYALHTFKVPGLIDHPLLRKILVLIPLILGFAFSVTCVVIGIQRLRKAF